MPPDIACIGWTTLPDRESARKIARGLVEARLAACAQVSSEIESFYHWESKFVAETEWRVTVKFLPENRQAVSEWLRLHHPYSVPQWLAVETTHVSPEYLAWMRAESCANPCGKAKDLI